MKVPAFLNHPKGQRGRGFCPHLDRVFHQDKVGVGEGFASTTGEVFKKRKKRGGGGGGVRPEVVMAARPKESLQEKKRKKLRVTSPTLEQVSAPSLECLVCGTDEGVIILFCSSGVVQRTSSNKVCLIKATEPQ